MTTDEPRPHEQTRTQHPHANPPPPSLRAQVDHILSEPESLAGQLVETVITMLILAVCLVFVLQSTPEVNEYVYRGIRVDDALEGMETAITLVFVIEYLVRWWAKGFDWRYPFRILPLVDLLACAPLLIASHDLQFVRILRLFRIFRLARVLKSRQFLFGEISEDHLLMLRILFTVFCLVFITGGIVYDLERHANPNIRSMADALYFAVVTLTTVGFGDISPVTFWGRFCTMIMILTGVFILPWQLTTLARHIAISTNKVQAQCRACGLRYHDPDASHCKACGSLIFQSYDGDGT